MNELFSYFTDVERVGQLIAKFGGTIFGALLIVIIGANTSKYLKTAHELTH